MLTKELKILKFFILCFLCFVHSVHFWNIFIYFSFAINNVFPIDVMITSLFSMSISQWVLTHRCSNSPVVFRWFSVLTNVLHWLYRWIQMHVKCSLSSDTAVGNSAPNPVLCVFVCSSLVFNSLSIPLLCYNDLLPVFGFNAKLLRIETNITYFTSGMPKGGSQIPLILKFGQNPFC